MLKSRRHHRLRFLCAAIAVLMAAAEAFGAVYYVSPTGSDFWSGTQADPGNGDGPFATLAKAASVLQAGDTLYLRNGTYRETLDLAVSGQPGLPITIQNYPGESPTLTGADVVTGWSVENGDIYSAPMNWNLSAENQIFANGVMVDEARWPNNTGSQFSPIRALADSGTATTLTDAELPGVEGEWAGARLWCAGKQGWVCWDAPVTGYNAVDKTLTFDPQTGDARSYPPQTDSPYVLMGVRSALDQAGEWWYDSTTGRLLLWAPGDGNPSGLMVEARKRNQVMDLSGCSYVQVIGLSFYCGGIVMDTNSNNISLRDLNGRYLGHSYQTDLGDVTSVLVRGSNVEVSGCEFSYSSGSVLSVDGTNHKIYNNHLHHGNYAGRWGGCVRVRGRGHWVCWNTMSDSGRDVVRVDRLAESIFEHNDLSHAGWLTHDLAMAYGHTTDFAGTEFRYNVVHDNLDSKPASGLGIYFDHATMNVIVHHNVFFNIGGDPVRINNPAYFNLVFNNTAYNCGGTTTFDHSGRNDMFRVRYYNNLFNMDFSSLILSIPEFELSNNMISSEPGFADPSGLDFTLLPDSPAIGSALLIPGINDGYKGGGPDIGAYEDGQAAWTAGHNFGSPPSIGTAPLRTNIGWFNAVVNGGFERDTLENWTQTGAGNASLRAGGGWDANLQLTTMLKRLRLGPVASGIEQQVILRAGAAHELSAWVLVLNPSDSMTLGIRLGSGQEISVSSNATVWTRLIIPFQASASDTSATVFLRKAGGTNNAFCENVGIPLPPEGDIFLRDSGAWYGTQDNHLSQLENWGGGAIPASHGVTASTRKDAVWDNRQSGNLSVNLDGGFGGYYGAGIVMTGNQVGSLTITNPVPTAQTLRLVNSTSGTVGGIQLASGAGVLTIGAAGAENPITLALGEGTAALNYYFTNSSNNTAVIEENVTITKGGSHSASLIFNGGNWSVKGVVGALSGTAGAGSLSVNNGSVTLSGNNTGDGAININNGILAISATNNLGTGTSAIRLGQTTTSGALQFTGSGNATISRLMRIGNGASANQGGSATIQNDGTGVLTFDNATFNESGTSVTARSLTLRGTNAGTNTISGVIANNNGATVSLIKRDSGTWNLTGENTYTGNTIIIGGRLVLGNNNTLPDASAVSLGAATLDVATFTDSAGSLDVTAAANINLGTGAAIAFADSSTIDWSGGILHLTGSFVSGSSLRFGTNASGLTPGHLGKIVATGYSNFALNSSGYLSATATDDYAAWQNANGSTGALDQDHDNDGVPNGIEYFLGGGTDTTGSTPLPGVTIAGETLSVTWAKAPGYTGSYGTHFWVETSENLTGAWTRESVGGNVSISGNNVTYTFPDPLSSRKFARLVVTGP